MKFKSILVITAITLSFFYCSSQKKKDSHTDIKDSFRKKNIAFITSKKSNETFRVLLSSEYYKINQYYYHEYIKRVKDEGGDKYMCEEMKKLNKINEAREGVIRIWLYPDSGKIMKVRPLQPTYLVEIDKILTEDIQRWNFTFPKKVVSPTKLDIRYRVVLQKKLTDEEILQQIRKDMN